MKHIKGTSVCKRFALMFIVCTVTVYLFKTSLNPLKLKMLNQNNIKNLKWSELKGQRSTAQANISDKNFIERENISRSTMRQGITPTTTMSTKYSSSHTENLHNERNYSLNIVTGNVSHVAKMNDVTKGTNLKIPRRNSTIKTKTVLQHLNDSDQEKLAQNNHKIKDLMSVGPFNFLKNYKNPCWESMEGTNKIPVIRCLPYFFLIGAPKSGSTDLHRRLIHHPDISRLVTKETHWLTRHQFYSRMGRESGSNLTDYMRHFTNATREIVMKEDANGYHRIIFGDCSATTIWDNDYWTILPQNRNLTEPKYTNADYIHHLNPNTKIIATLRNPVDRLYSSYLYFYHGTPQGFHKGVVQKINKTQQCLRSNSLRHCIYSTQKKENGKVEMISIRVGIYHMHLKEFFHVFPRDQVMVIKLEDFSKETMAYMQKLFAFLNVSEVDMKQLETIANPKTRANIRRKIDRNTGEMLPETREILEKFYYPHNELLTELLGEQFNYNRDSNRYSNKSLTDTI